MAHLFQHYLAYASQESPATATVVGIREFPIPDGESLALLIINREPRLLRESVTGTWVSFVSRFPVVVFAHDRYTNWHISPAGRSCKCPTYQTPEVNEL